MLMAGGEPDITVQVIDLAQGDHLIYLGDRVVGLLPHPGRIGITLDIDLPRLRDQLATRELPEFLHLRRELFDFIKRAER